MLEVRKLGSPIASIFGICIKFLDLLFLDEFTTVLLVLPPPPLTTSLLSALNIFKANFLHNPVVFNREARGAAILLKLWIKRQ